MRRMILLAAGLALCLSGCASDKSFEKQILGHPAPESPSDTGWSRTPPPPPPPPPPTNVPPTAPGAAQPVPGAGQPVPEPTPASAFGSAPQRAPASPGAAPQAASPSAADYAKPKPFVPAPAAGTTQPAPAAGVAMAAPAPGTATPQTAQPEYGHSGGMVFTFQVGAFAHAQSATTLKATLEKRGFSTRLEQGKLNNKTFYTVFASKEGTRAALEGELLTMGVTEPRLLSEKPAVSAPAAPAPAASQPAPAPIPPAQAPAAKPRPTPNYAPPKVEPAPPLPDGYVPPPPKKGE